MAETAVRPYKTAKDKTLTHIGAGPLKVNDVDIGFTGGKYDVEKGTETYVHEDDTPAEQVGEIITKAFYRVTFQALQITPENYLIMMGAKNNVLKIWNGTEEYDTYWKTSLLEQQLLQFEKRRSSELPSIRLDWGNVVETTGDEPVITKVTGETDAVGTPLVRDVDYDLDATLGEVIALPNVGIVGYVGIAEGDWCRCKYKSVPPAGTELKLDPKLLFPDQYKVELAVTDANTKKEIVHFMPVAEVTVGSIDVKENALWAFNVTMEAVMSENEADAAYPLGYTKIDGMVTA